MLDAVPSRGAPAALLSKAMPKRRGLESQPWLYLKNSKKPNWPEGDLEDKAPEVAHFAKGVAQRLKDLLAEDDIWTAYSLAKEADVSRQTVTNILQGETWTDLPTIYRLEVALGRQLWVNDDIK